MTFPEALLEALSPPPKRGVLTSEFITIVGGMILTAIVTQPQQLLDLVGQFPQPYGSMAVSVVGLVIAQVTIRFNNKRQDTKFQPPTGGK
jgi:hypothetical protein